MTELDLFAAAIAIADAGNRAIFLDRECADQPDLRIRLERLVEAHFQSNPLLDKPLAELGSFDSKLGQPDNGATGEHTSKFEDFPRSGRTSDFAPLTEAGTVIAGRYTLVEKIGEGGMGEVWVAKQSEPIKRKVGLKVIKAGMDTKAVLQRFNAERQALALMDHPNIAKVLDGGMTDNRRPYFVMELVNGLPLTKFCDEAKLGIRQRLQLFVSICQAVQHAHQKGIVHRDLKPSNILVTIIDSRPVPKVIDFGVAKAVGGRLTDESLSTGFGAVVGTLEYMSPEQAGFTGDDVDTRADIYSLGVILYELLTGLRPIDSKRLRHAALTEMARILREEEPSKPSTRLSTDESLPSLAALRDTEPRKLMALLRGELDWVVMKCLEKQRDRRYETANGLVRDLERYLADEPVEARPPSAGYRFKKYVVRNKGLVAAAGAVAAVLVLGLIGTLWQARAARAEAARADERAKAADESAKAEAARASELKLVSDFQAGMLAQINPTKAGKELTDNITTKFAAALAKAKIPEADRPALIESFKAQWSRVNATDAARELINRTILKPAIKSINEKFKDQPVVDAQLRQVLANRYRELGLLDEAMPLQESALATRRRVLGEEHPDTLVSIANMGRQLEAKGRLAEAELCYREALAKFRRILGEEHLDTLVLIGNMGTLLWSEGKLAEAEPYYSEALEKTRRLMGEDDPKTLVSINSMGVLLWTQGKLTEAEPYLREALQKRRRQLGGENPNTLNSINNMGFLLKAQGKLSEAEPYFREALEKFRRVLGEEHPTTLISIDNMGSLLRDQGKLAEAEPYLREALEKFRRVLGKEHPDTLLSVSNLGTLFQAQGKSAEAELLFREVLETRIKSLAPNDWLIASARLNLGGLLLGQKKFVEAESLLIDAYGGFASAKNTPRKPRDFPREACENMVKLYESWDSAEPGKGYDTKALEWKTKRNALKPASPEPNPAVNKKS